MKPQTISLEHAQHLKKVVHAEASTFIVPLLTLVVGLVIGLDQINNSTQAYEMLFNSKCDKCGVFIAVNTFVDVFNDKVIICQVRPISM